MKILGLDIEPQMVITSMESLSIPLGISTNALPTTSGTSLSMMISPSNLVQGLLTSSPTIYGTLEQNMNGYIWRSVLDTIPTFELEKTLKIFESTYSLSSEEFYKLWQKGEFVDNADTNLWASLILQLT